MSSKYMISSFRPNMVMHDSMRHAETKELKTRRLDRDFMKNHPMTQGHTAFMHSWACQDFDPEVNKEMEIIRADKNGNFFTDDPMLAFYIVDQLEKGIEVNMPDQNKTPAKYKISEQSSPLPTRAEYDAYVAAQREKAEKASKAK